MKRCILETPFAAPKDLRDAFAAASLACANAKDLDRNVYAALYKAKAKAQKTMTNAQAKHKRYLKACMRHLLFNGWAPFASHCVYPQFLDDNIPAEREIGMNAGKPYWEVCDDVWFGMDLGMSPGMWWARDQHMLHHRTIYNLELGPNWDK